MIKAAQYLRMSTDEQKYSLEIQSSLIAEFAKREGYELVKTYADAGKSGVSGKGRDGLKALIRDVLDRPSYEVVLVLDISRWGRFQDPDEAGHFEFLCRSAGVKVRYCDEAFDDSESSTAIIMKAVKRAMAADYSRNLSQRVRAGKQRSVDRGFTPGALAPYGFVRQVVEVDGSPGRLLALGQRRSRMDQMVKFVPGPPDEVQTLRRIFSLFVSDYLSLKEVAGRLNAERVPYRHPGLWDVHRVRRVLQNEMAKGILVYNKRVCRLGEPKILTPPSLWTRHVMGIPLVPVALFDEAQAKLARLAGRQYTDEDLIERLKLLLRRRGKLTKTLVNASLETPSIDVYIKRFGSAAEAFARAGYAHSRHW